MTSTSCLKVIDLHILTLCHIYSGDCVILYKKASLLMFETIEE